MSEDEAFIRAIVDAPGDDLPRLVYADWLDDRSDPRGPYLRAEREAVETGDIERLRKLAVGLDPVWVARVSMPPVGVCLDHVELLERGPQVSESDITSVEQRLGVRLPPDYCAFALNYNGGWISPLPALQTPTGEMFCSDGVGWGFDQLSKLGRLMFHPPASDEQARRRGPVEAWASHFLLIGHDPDWIGGVLLGVCPPMSGHVRVFDTISRPEHVYDYQHTRSPLARTFAEFLSYLPGYGPNSR